MRKIPLIVVCGPTASGKTALAVSLAKIFNCEIVSADSMQIYKQMQIATAKPTPEEQQNIKHHLIDFLEPDEDFSVADYVRLAKDCIEKIYYSGKTPLLCGGTGLYISSLVDNISFDDTCSSTELRRELSDLAKEKGGEYLLETLSEFDPETAARLHPNNITRIIRAIEVYRVSGITMSEAVRNSRRESPYDACMIGITCYDRSKLYDRINLRVDRMMEAGLLDEAKAVLSNSKLKTSYQAIGYKELKRYFDNEASLEECIQSLKMSTRRYAKRQLTWFRRDERINWLYTDLIGSEKGLTDAAAQIITDSGIVKVKAVEDR